MNAAIKRLADAGVPSRRRLDDRNLQVQPRRVLGHLAYVLSRIVNAHPNNQIDDLLPRISRTQNGSVKQHLRFRRSPTDAQG